MSAFDPNVSPPAMAYQPVAVAIGGVRYRLNLSRMLTALATRANAAGVTTQAGLDAMLAGALTEAQQSVICKAIAEALVIEADI